MDFVLFVIAGFLLAWIFAFLIIVLIGVIVLPFVYYMAPLEYPECYYLWLDVLSAMSLGFIKKHDL